MQWLENRLKPESRGNLNRFWPQWTDLRHFEVEPSGQTWRGAWMTPIRSTPDENFIIIKSWGRGWTWRRGGKAGDFTLFCRVFSDASMWNDSLQQTLLHRKPRLPRLMPAYYKQTRFVDFSLTDCRVLISSFSSSGRKISLATHKCARSEAWISASSPALRSFKQFSVILFRRWWLKEVPMPVS